MSNVLTFEALIDMWQDRYQRALSGVDVTDVRQSDEYVQKQSQLENEYRTLEPLSNRYLSLVFGRNRGQTVTEQAAGATLCFFPRIFRVATVDDFPTPLAEIVAKSLHDTFFLGMACHFVTTNAPSRSRISKVDTHALFEDFLEASIVAERHLGKYNKAAKNIPKYLFNVQYGIIEPMIKDDLRVGFWKRGKVHSNYNNVFYSGILLPMIAETRASKL